MYEKNKFYDESTLDRVYGDMYLTEAPITPAIEKVILEKYINITMEISNEGKLEAGEKAWFFNLAKLTTDTRWPFSKNNRDLVEQAKGSGEALLLHIFRKEKEYYIEASTSVFSMYKYWIWKYGLNIKIVNEKYNFSKQKAYDTWRDWRTQTEEVTVLDANDDANEEEADALALGVEVQGLLKKWIEENGNEYEQLQEVLVSV